MHVPFDYKIAPLLIAKYNPIMEIGKVLKYVYVKSQKREHQIISAFLFQSIELALSFNMASCSLGGTRRQSKDATAGIGTMLVTSHGQKGKVWTAAEVTVPETLCF